MNEAPPSLCPPPLFLLSATKYFVSATLASLSKADAPLLPGFCQVLLEVGHI